MDRLRKAKGERYPHVVFWFFSIGGALTLFTYALHRRDPSSSLLIAGGQSSRESNHSSYTPNFGGTRTMKSALDELILLPYGLSLGIRSYAMYSRRLEALQLPLKAPRDRPLSNTRAHDA
jgi:hypothetical protein